MALVVNTNVMSLMAQRNLGQTTQAQNKSLERLSSGLRINRAADDAAGLAISEGLRSQVRGLNQAIRNSNDGISILSTAEGSLNEATSIVQRIRELAVQAANDTNSSANRASIQAEVDEQLSELTRMGNTVEFNGLSLLDGTFTNKSLQVGAFQNQTLSFSLSDMRATALGENAQLQTGATTTALTAGDLTLNGTDVGASSADGVSYVDSDSSSIAIAAAINAVSGTSGVTAEVDDTVVEGNVGGNDIEAIALDGSSNSMSINGVNIGAVTVLDNDSDDALVDTINEFTNQTGVTASTDGDNQLVLTADDGRNITVQTTGSVGGNLALTANQSTNLAGTIADGTTRGTVTMHSASAFSVAGAAPASAGLTAQSVAITANSAISSINVTTASGATNAIRTIDFALSQISTQRSSIGATTNRLESMIRNLRTVSENLSASDSRIRDVDFASETANSVRSQILQQAGLSILAQANVQPQAALSLLG